jgi:hypothetical protein
LTEFSRSAKEVKLIKILLKTVIEGGVCKPIDAARIWFNTDFVFVTNLVIAAYGGTSEYPNTIIKETALIRLHNTALKLCGHISTSKCGNGSIFISRCYLFQKRITN